MTDWIYPSRFVCEPNLFRSVINDGSVWSAPLQHGPHRIGTEARPFLSTWKSTIEVTLYCTNLGWHHCTKRLTCYESVAYFSCRNLHFFFSSEWQVVRLRILASGRIVWHAAVHPASCLDSFSPRDLESGKSIARLITSQVHFRIQCIKFSNFGIGIYTLSISISKIVPWCKIYSINIVWGLSDD